MKDIKNIQTIINTLNDSLWKHNELYYKGTPEIEDREYDRMFDKLKDLVHEYPKFSPSNSILENVGFSSSENLFNKVEHAIPMLSLNNSYNEEDIARFLKSMNKIISHNDLYSIENKFDGISLELDYIDGVLNVASTRGNGIIGDDITANVLSTKAVKKILPRKFTGFIRGELVMSFKVFDELNVKRLLFNKEKYKNPRNTVSGLMRSKDPNEIKDVKLCFKAYYISPHYDAQYLNFTALRNLGFDVQSPCLVKNSPNAIMKEIRRIELNKANYEYPLDGAVIKLNDLNKAEKIGNTSKAPKHSISFKFETTKETTVIKDIIWQVGRTGMVTPVAILQPVELDGSLVSKATLHNYDNIVEKDIRIGDVVEIEKAAEIIPQVIKVDYRSHFYKRDPIMDMIKVCPVCGSELKSKTNRIDMFCENQSCKGRLIRQIIHYAGTEAMNIKGLGDKIIESLVMSYDIENIFSIYELEEKYNNGSLLNTEVRNKPKVMENIFKNIEKSKNNDPYRLIYGFGIRLVGKSVSKILINKCKNIENIFALTKQEMKEFLGDVVSNELYYWIMNADTNQVLLLLNKYGINTTSTKKSIRSEKFKDKIFVLTGSMNTYSNKQEIIDIIESHSGIVKNNISRKTDYLICGIECGSKLDKARELGVKIVEERDFIYLLSQ